ncbi:MAG: D-hexose-6-phosphate mutarotase [Chloroflexota bacterium]
MTHLSPPLDLVAPDGARTAIYPHGAHVVSWIPAAGGERLFLSPASEFQAGAPIRGGVPVIFPQFSGLGDLPKHGFARLLSWQPGLAEYGPDFATQAFTLQAGEDTRRHWPYAFRAEMRVIVGGQRLALAFAVTNMGDEPFTFTAALHTYFQVDDVETAAVVGLAGVRYHDTTARPWAAGTQRETALRFPGEVDRIYVAAPHSLQLQTPERTTHIESEGFPDVVTWNPGPAKCARLPDMQPDDYRRFVCVEAAAIEPPVTLSAGQRWEAKQTLAAAGRR